MTGNSFEQRLRRAAMTALAAGAAGSLGFMLHAGRRTGAPILLPIFAIWVLSPFAALAAADARAKRWPLPARTTLYWTTLVVAVASLAIYGVADLGPLTRKTPVFVAVPPLSWAIPAIAVSIAALTSRRPSS